MNTSEPHLSNIWTAPKPQPAAPPPQRPRVGHIARLPKALREIVNRMLDDGKPYQEILGELEKHRDQWPPGITALADHHLGSWRSGGYQDWLFHQEQLVQLRAKEEFTLDFLNATEPGELHKAGLKLAFLRLVQALHQMNISNCENMAYLRPASYAALLASINRLSRSTLAFTQFNQVMEEARARAERKKMPRGISPEAQAQIDELLGLGVDREAPPATNHNFRSGTTDDGQLTTDNHPDLSTSIQT